MVWKLGIDTGGTFSDCVLVDDDGNYSLSKVPSSAENPRKVFTEALEMLAKSRNLTVKDLLSRIGLILHGTTLAVNALIQLKVAKTGLICTQGFRDILEFREGRKESNDYFLPLPPEIIPRYLRQGVTERIGANGEEIIPLNVDDVHQAINKFRLEGVQSVAVCLLNSYMNPAHENQVKEIIEHSYPEAYVSISHDVLPQIGEYERTSTTAINACLGPLMRKYITELEALLRSLGYSGEIRYMQANAGIASGEALNKTPILSINSGPAAGLIAGSYFGRLVNEKNVVTMDMGGTSFDTCLIHEGTTDIITNTDFNRLRISIPVVNVNIIGAGGGSIARIDPGGILRVGPESAEASPGPVCYDQGGEEPTVTDAFVALGYFNPDYLLGGKLKVNYAAAVAAIGDKIGKPLNLDYGHAALGIVKVANLNMADAIRVISLERGYDIRDFMLVSAGGCGAASAAMLAKELDVSKVMIPRIASLFCAFGALVSDIRHDYIMTYTTPLHLADCSKLNQLFNEMEQKATSDLEKEGVAASDIRFDRSIDLKYEGEVDHCMVPIPRFEFTPERLPEITECLHRVHENLFTFRDKEAVPLASNLRLTAYGSQPKLGLVKKPFVGSDPSKAKTGIRKALFNEITGYEDATIYDGSRLESGNVVVGPAIVEEETTTIVVTPKSRLELDSRDFYMLTF